MRSTIGTHRCHRSRPHPADGQPGARAVRCRSRTTLDSSCLPRRSPRPRRRSSSSSRPACANGAPAGILWWNVLDGWPQFSDAVVDYYFGKKLAYHYHLALAAAGLPVSSASRVPDKYLPLVAGNDTLQPGAHSLPGPGKQTEPGGGWRGVRPARQPELAGGQASAPTPATSACT